MRRDTLAGGEPIISAEWDVYLGEGALTYLKTPCGESDTAGVFSLDAAPAFGWESADAERRRRRGDLGFQFEHSTAFGSTAAA